MLCTVSIKPTRTLTSHSGSLRGVFEWGQSLEAKTSFSAIHGKLPKWALPGYYVPNDLINLIVGRHNCNSMRRSAMRFGNYKIKLNYCNYCIRNVDDTVVEICYTLTVEVIK